MGFLERIRLIVHANLNELLAQAESPEAAIDQMLLDMDAGILELRREAASAIAALKLAERRRERAVQEAHKWERSAEAAVRQGDDDLARAALRRVSRVQVQVQTLGAAAREHADLASKLRQELRQTEDRVQEIRSKRDTLVARKRAVEARRRLADRVDGPGPSGRRSASEADAVVNGFGSSSELQRQVETSLAEVEAREELEQARAASDPGERLERLCREDDIERELEELKRRLG